MDSVALSPRVWALSQGPSVSVPCPGPPPTRGTCPSQATSLPSPPCSGNLKPQNSCPNSTSVLPLLVQAPSTGLAWVGHDAGGHTSRFKHGHLCNRVKCLASPTPSGTGLLCAHGLQANGSCLVLHTDMPVLRGILLLASFTEGALTKKCLSQ